MPSSSRLDVGDETGVLVEPPAGAKPPMLPLAPALLESGPGRQRTARETHRVTRQRGRVSIAWFLLLIVLGAGALAGFFAFKRWQVLAEKARSTDGALTEAHARAARAEQRVLEVEAALMRERDRRDSVARSLAGATERAELARRRAEQADELEKKLQDIVGEQGTITRDDDTSKLTLEMVDKVLFRLGEATLTERGEAVLAKVGEALKSFPDKQVWVQGHTDRLPISNDVFASNWELSSARALTVVHYLEDIAGVDPRRLAAVGFGEHRPVSRRRKARNRRIEIVLFPREVRLIRE